MKWIDIKNEQPANYQPVIIWGEGYGVLPAVYYSEGDPGFFAEECGYDGREMEKREWVSHWMPFPDPPTVIQITRNRKVYTNT